MLSPLRYVDPSGLNEEAPPYWREQGFSSERAWQQAASHYCLTGSCHGQPQRGAERFANSQERGQLYVGAGIITVTAVTGGAASVATPQAAAILLLGLEVNNLVNSDVPGGRTTPARRAPATVPPARDNATGSEIGRIVVDRRGNAMIEPAGGRTVAAGPGGRDTHTLYPNGSNYQRLNAQGHAGNPTPHGHGHLPGTGPGMKGQGLSIDPLGRVVPWSSPAAHWPIK